MSIRCSNNTIIPAHRAIVCPRSRVLAATVDGNFKVCIYNIALHSNGQWRFNRFGCQYRWAGLRSVQEALSQEIYLEDDEPDIVAMMVDFLYGSDYDDYRSLSEEEFERMRNQNVAESLPILDVGSPANETTATKEPDFPSPPKKLNSHSLIINAKVYIIADKNDILALKQWAAKKYKDVLEDAWNSPIFIESIRLIYDNTIEMDRILRDVVVREVKKHARDLIDREEFVDLYKSQPDFAIEVLREVVQQVEELLPKGSAPKKNKK